MARFVSAYEAADIDALVGMLTDDAFMSMPPMPLEYLGRDVVGRFCSATLFAACCWFDLVPTRANGQPAFGAYFRASGRVRPAAGLIAVALAGDWVSAMTRFEAKRAAAIRAACCLSRR